MSRLGFVSGGALGEFYEGESAAALRAVSPYSPSDSDSEEVIDGGTLAEPSAEQSAEALAEELEAMDASELFGEDEEEEEEWEECDSEDGDGLQLGKCDWDDLMEQLTQLDEELWWTCRGAGLSEGRLRAALAKKVGGRLERWVEFDSERRLVWREEGHVDLLLVVANCTTKCLSQAVIKSLQNPKLLCRYHWGVYPARAEDANCQKLAKERCKELAHGIFFTMQARAWLVSEEPVVKRIMGSYGGTVRPEEPRWCKNTMQVWVALKVRQLTDPDEKIAYYQERVRLLGGMRGALARDEQSDEQMLRGEFMSWGAREEQMWDDHPELREAVQQQRRLAVEKARQEHAARAAAERERREERALLALELRERRLSGAGGRGWRVVSRTAPAAAQSPPAAALRREQRLAQARAMRLRLVRVHAQGDARPAWFARVETTSVDAGRRAVLHLREVRSEERQREVEADQRHWRPLGFVRRPRERQVVLRVAGDLPVSTVAEAADEVDWEGKPSDFGNWPQAVPALEARGEREVTGCRSCGALVVVDRDDERLKCGLCSCEVWAPKAARSTADRGRHPLVDPATGLQGTERTLALPPRPAVGGEGGGSGESESESESDEDASDPELQFAPPTPPQQVAARRPRLEALEDSLGSFVGALQPLVAVSAPAQAAQLEMELSARMEATGATLLGGCASEMQDGELALSLMRSRQAERSLQVVASGHQAGRSVSRKRTCGADASRFRANPLGEGEDGEARWDAQIEATALRPAAAAHLVDQFEACWQALLLTDLLFEDPSLEACASDLFGGGDDDAELLQGLLQSHRPTVHSEVAELAALVCEHPEVVDPGQRRLEAVPGRLAPREVVVDDALSASTRAHAAAMQTWARLSDLLTHLLLRAANSGPAALAALSGRAPPLLPLLQRLLLELPAQCAGSAHELDRRVALTVDTVVQQATTLPQGELLPCVAALRDTWARAPPQLLVAARYHMAADLAQQLAGHRVKTAVGRVAADLLLSPREAPTLRSLPAGQWPDYLYRGVSDKHHAVALMLLCKLVGHAFRHQGGSLRAVADAMLARVHAAAAQTHLHCVVECTSAFAELFAATAAPKAAGQQPEQPEQQDPVWRVLVLPCAGQRLDRVLLAPFALDDAEPFSPATRSLGERLALTLRAAGRSGASLPVAQAAAGAEVVALLFETLLARAHSRAGRDPLSLECLGPGTTLCDELLEVIDAGPLNLDLLTDRTYTPRGLDKNTATGQIMQSDEPVGAIEDYARNTVTRHLPDDARRTDKCTLRELPHRLSAAVSRACSAGLEAFMRRHLRPALDTVLFQGTGANAAKGQAIALQQLLSKAAASPRWASPSRICGISSELSCGQWHSLRTGVLLHARLLATLKPGAEGSKACSKTKEQAVALVANDRVLASGFAEIRHKHRESLVELMGQCKPFLAGRPLAPHELQLLLSAVLRKAVAARPDSHALQELADLLPRALALGACEVNRFLRRIFDTSLKPEPDQPWQPKPQSLVAAALLGTRLSADDARAAEQHMVHQRNALKQLELQHSKRFLSEARGAAGPPTFQPVQDLAPASLAKHNNTYYAPFDLWSEHDSLLVTHKRFPRHKLEAPKPKRRRTSPVPPTEEQPQAADRAVPQAADK